MEICSAFQSGALNLRWFVILDSTLEYQKEQEMKTKYSYFTLILLALLKMGIQEIFPGISDLPLDMAVLTNLAHQNFHKLMTLQEFLLEPYQSGMISPKHYLSVFLQFSFGK
jgi:hypothetical protein